VIIFGLVFIKKQNQNRFEPTGFGLVILEQKPVFFVWLGFSGLGSVWFFRFQGYKTKTEPNRSVF